jgi:hypothetical protein
VRLGPQLTSLPPPSIQGLYDKKKSPGGPTNHRGFHGGQQGA